MSAFTDEQVERYRRLVAQPETVEGVVILNASFLQPGDVIEIDRALAGLVEAWRPDVHRGWIVRWEIGGAEGLLRNPDIERDFRLVGGPTFDARSLLERTPEPAVVKCPPREPGSVSAHAHCPHWIDQEMPCCWCGDNEDNPESDACPAAANRATPEPSPEPSEPPQPEQPLSQIDDLVRRTWTWLNQPPGGPTEAFSIERLYAECFVAEGLIRELVEVVSGSTPAPSAAPAFFCHECGTWHLTQECPRPYQAAIAERNERNAAAALSPTEQSKALQLGTRILVRSDFGEIFITSIVGRAVKNGECWLTGRTDGGGWQHDTDHGRTWWTLDEVFVALAAAFPNSTETT